MACGRGIKLQVLVSTYGREGILRLAKSVRPQVEGVVYIVNWQLPDEDCEIPAELIRPDFMIEKSHSRGLSRNRNELMRIARGPYCLFSDDDVDYTEEGLRYVIDTFESHPKLDFATFEFEGADNKKYPAEEFDMKHPPKNYYVSSIEIAYRQSSLYYGDIRFNEKFGIGARFVAGEEELLVHDLVSYGYRGRFFPKVIASHKDESTSVRLASTPEYIETKGAVFRITHPVTWPLRMLAHARRCESQGWTKGPLEYCKAWTKSMDKKRLVNYLPVVLVMAIVFVLSMLMHWQGDAVAFRYFIPAENEDFSSIPLNNVWEIWESMWNHWHNSTGRFVTHFIVQLFCAFIGKTGFAICNSLVWGALILLIVKMSHENEKSFPTMAFVSLLVFVIFFPLSDWKEQSFPFEPPHQINYVWMGLLNLIWIKTFFNEDYVRVSVWKLILLGIFSFLVGQGNESFSIPICAGTLYFSWTIRFTYGARQRVIMFCYLLGTLALVLAPSNFARLGQDHWSLMHTAEGLLPGLLIPAIWLVSILIRRKKGGIYELSHIINFDIRDCCYVVIGVNYLMAIALGMESGTRMLTCASLFMAIFIMQNMREFKYKRVSAFIFICAILWIGACRGAEIERLNNKNIMIERLYHQSKDGVVVLPDSIFVYNVREFIVRPHPYMMMEREINPGKPNIAIRPASMAKLDLTKDTNIVIPIGEQVWLMIQSRRNPAKFVIEKTFMAEILGKKMAPRVMDWNDKYAVFDSTELWRAAIYINERRPVRSQVRMEP